MTLIETAFDAHQVQGDMPDGVHDRHDHEASNGDGGLKAGSVTVLFATETGASEDVAKALGKAVEQNGLTARVIDMADADIADLADIEIALFVASTTGDGDAPYAAEGFFAALNSADAISLDHLRYAVLALGDSTYEHFCAAGRRLDEALVALGARRLLDRVDCDIDYEEPAAEWRAAVLATITHKPVVTPSVGLSNGLAAARREKYRLTEGIVVESRVLTGEGSTKATRHLALSLSDTTAGAYEPGDALGVIVENDPALVAAVLDAGRLAAETVVTLKGETLMLGDALRLYLDVTAVTPRFLEAWGAASASQLLPALGSGSESSPPTVVTRDHHIVDIMRRYPAADLEAQTFVNMLRSLQPRLYSIASSLKAVPGQVHLTIAPVAYMLWGEERRGVATGQLCERTPVGTRVQVYVHSNSHFRLPAPEVPVIMIGAGTGVAPYRGFLQERAAQEGAGRAWLFFGERNRSTDFLYEDELSAFLQSGILTRIDTAFSRDGEAKVYVQHRLVEEADELCRWIADGAHVFVCGDAANMAPDVHRALISVFQIGMGLTAPAAEAFLRTLQSEDRYQRDVY
ncbi:flavodoxin domain-containing protein (plasmid) [Sphingobium sp. SJ10-10]|uniref:assimilatory sulfite reductase (NADPH) n=1 Tax=Sphingomonas sp. NS2 TaxID=908605 RepID=A0A0D4ZYL9_9SPHN|nr:MULTISPECIES: flavodoxin domain-containing protein [unclassified Sphingobium]AJW29372.1 Sulfite reductase [NADPH] flavoprotein alpha-component [Sphingomonas sp. NS2]MEC6699594.1 flavodoxin domain-containing protein [Sphingobium sp. SJ10-10]NML91716.1 sulfite reductase [NADPH] flavoprotein alpha-component [Sphingobium sp. TB-6]